MGDVIQRLYDCMGFILLNMRERVFERVSSRMCEWRHPECVNGFIQRLYNCMSFILLNMRESGVIQKV